MANMVTRTLTTFEVKAEKVVVNRKERKFESHVVGTAEVTSLGKPTRKGIVAAFAENGIHIEKGTEFEFTPIAYTTYGCTLEDFLSVAHVIANAEGGESEDEQ